MGKEIGMKKIEETMPSESEWLIMEVLWESGTPLTSMEVLNRLQGRSDMTLRMVRVLMSRLSGKGLLGFTVDENDARVYHYHAIKSKEECLREKSRRFVNSYFAGSRTSAVAALLQGITLTDGQIQELEEILEKSKEQDQKRGRKK